MKKAVFLLIIGLTGVLQVTLLDYFKIFNVKPDLLLITIVLGSLYFDLKWALFFALTAGVFKDTFSTAPLGINTALFAVWSLVVARLAHEVSLDNNLRQAVLIVIVTVAHHAACGLILAFLGNLVPFGIILRIIFLEALYTAAVLPLVFKLTKPLSLSTF